MREHQFLRSNLKSLIGVVICGWSAALLAFFFRSQNQRYVLPLLFLVVVMLVALRYGVSAGVLGSIVAALVFAVFLYKPLGSVSVENKDARANLGWMVLGGLTFSYLLGSKTGGSERPKV